MGVTCTICTSPLVEDTLLLFEVVDNCLILNGDDEVGLGGATAAALVTATGCELESGIINSGSAGGEVVAIILLLVKSTDLRCLSRQILQTAKPMGKICPLQV